MDEMTPESRARQVQADYITKYGSTGYHDSIELTVMMGTAIREAVAAENAACAEIARDFAVFKNPAILAITESDETAGHWKEAIIKTAEIIAAAIEARVAPDVKGGDA